MSTGRERAGTREREKKEIKMPPEVRDGQTTYRTMMDDDGNHTVRFFFFYNHRKLIGQNLNRLKTENGCTDNNEKETEAREMIRSFVPCSLPP